MTKVLHDDFDGIDLDRTTWLPHYLPAWSSLDLTAADWVIADSALTLTIPVEHPRWCPDEHPEPLRVSGVQSGDRSGPVGSTDGQQRFRDDLTVREAQPRFAGWLTTSGRVEIRMRMDLSPRSMAAMWLAGFEEHPLDAGEVCVVEVFGRSVDPGRSAHIGVGVKAVNDPRLADDFAAPRLDLDVAEYHTYAAEWDASSARFEVDGHTLRNCAQPPTYPMQIMIALFDFPAWGPELGHEPSLSVDWVRGDPGGTSSGDLADEIRPSTSFPSLDAAAGSGLAVGKGVTDAFGSPTTTGRRPSDSSRRRHSPSSRSAGRSATTTLRRFDEEARRRHDG